MNARLAPFLTFCVALRARPISVPDVVGNAPEPDLTEQVQTNPYRSQIDGRAGRAGTFRIWGEYTTGVADGAQEPEAAGTFQLDSTRNPVVLEIVREPPMMRMRCSALASSAEGASGVARSFRPNEPDCSHPASSNARNTDGRFLDDTPHLLGR